MLSAEERREIEAELPHYPDKQARKTARSPRQKPQEWSWIRRPRKPPMGWSH